MVAPSNPSPVDQADEISRIAREERRKRAITGEASRGLWQRVTFPRAIGEATVIFIVWRLLELIPIAFWPAALFPAILLLRLALRFMPPVWAALRVIATRREKMSRRFFMMAGILAITCTFADGMIALFVGEAAQPFGGPLYGPDVTRFAAHAHHLSIGTFLFGTFETLGFLLVYYLLAIICTRLAQGGFLRFTMPAGDGRVTL